MMELGEKPPTRHREALAVAIQKTALEPARLPRHFAAHNDEKSAL